MLQHHHFTALGGPCELTLGGVADPAQSREWIGMAQTEILRIEHTYSRYRTDSVVGRVNSQAGGDWVEGDEEFNHLLDMAEAWHAATGGLFDITSGVWRRVWNFKKPDAAPPTETDLAALRPLVGWHRVQREAGRIRLPEAGMEIDLGGLGKEYAVDRVVDCWRAAGVNSGLVNLGGDVRVIGQRPDGQPWRLGVRDPGRRDALLATVPLSDAALTTSGNYERYVRGPQGQRLGHVLNPHTGQPVLGFSSVTVVSRTALQAGFLSTAALLDAAGALQRLRDSGLPFLAVDDEGRIHQAHDAHATSGE